MASKPSATSSKEHILKTFQQIVEHQKALASRIVTAEEAAERAREREVVKAASTYTVEVIIKGLADLQLHFGDTIDAVARRLTDESSRLDQLRRAIEVETAYAKQLNDIMIAADALSILKQEHREALRTFEEHARERREALETDIRDTRASWEEERGQHEREVKKHEETLARDRKKAEDDFSYELVRKRKLEADAATDKRAKTERRLAEEDAKKTRQWADREAALAAKAEEHKTHKARVEAFPQEMEEAVKKAREEALKETFAEAKVKAELLEKEVEANRKVYALQIESLEETLKKQAEQIDSLTAKLAVALTQSQSLAMKAIEGTAHAHATRREITA
ncbi:MAG TPA: hypothetical protein VLS89_12520 [Candidatus Nanopelagicales bacterium]|nr:hypothetical protein [Candidatus Nanopelagicales bacterium]